MNPTKSNISKNGSTWHEDNRRGKNAEAYILCHSTELTGCAVLEPLKQIPRTEGDFLMTNGEIYEVKADARRSYLKTGNVCVQISNDKGTSTGVLHDMQDPERRHVDKNTYVLCLDYECKIPYAVITMAVEKFASLCGCPAGGCGTCGRCTPGKNGWQREALPDARLSKNENVLLLPLSDVLQDDDVHVVVLRDVACRTPVERRNYLLLVNAAIEKESSLLGHNYIYGTLT